MKEFILKEIYMRLVLLGLASVLAWSVQWSALQLGVDVFAANRWPIFAVIAGGTALSLAIKGPDLQWEVVGGLIGAVPGTVTWVATGAFNAGPSEYHQDNAHTAPWLVLVGIFLGLFAGVYVHSIASRKQHQ